MNAQEIQAHATRYVGKYEDQVAQLLGVSVPQLADGMSTINVQVVSPEYIQAHNPGAAAYTEGTTIFVPDNISPQDLPGVIVYEMTHAMIQSGAGDSVGQDGLQGGPKAMKDEAYSQAIRIKLGFADPSTAPAGTETHRLLALPPEKFQAGARAISTRPANELTPQYELQPSSSSTPPPVGGGSTPPPSDPGSYGTGASPSPSGTPSLQPSASDNPQPSPAAPDTSGTPAQDQAGTDQLSGGRHATAAGAYIKDKNGPMGTDKSGHYRYETFMNMLATGLPWTEVQKYTDSSTQAALLAQLGIDATATPQEVYTAAKNFVAGAGQASSVDAKGKPLAKDAAGNQTYAPVGADTGGFTITGNGAGGTTTDQQWTTKLNQLHWSLWGEPATQTWIDQQIKSGKSLFEIEQEERAKPAFMHTKTAEDAASNAAATVAQTLGFR